MLRAVLLFTFIASMCWLFSLIYNKRLVRWKRLSDTEVPITVLYLYDGSESIYVYSYDNGQNMALRFTTGVYNVTSDIMVIPKRYHTPYEYLKSGELNNLMLRHLGVLEMVVDADPSLRGYQYSIDYELELDFNSHAYRSLNLH